MAAQEVLVATKRLYESACPSIRPLVRWSVRPLVMVSDLDLLGATFAVYIVLLLPLLLSTR